MKSTGQLLKEHREKSGLTHAEVSLSTKISVRMLKALEAGDLETLPAPSFIRGFVRSYASYLKLDPDELVKMFNEEMAPPAPPPPLEGETEASSSVSSEDVATPRPAPNLKSQTVSEEISSHDILNAKPSVLKKVSMGLALLGLIGLIFFVFQTVKKYEREGVVEEVPEVAEIDGYESDSSEESEKSAETSPEKSENAAASANVEPETSQEQPSTTESLSAAAPKATEPESPKETEAVEPPKPEIEVTPTPESSVSAQPEPTSAPKVAETPKAIDVVKSEPPKPEATEAKPSAKAEAKAMSQEIIVEALDKVEITLRPASGQKQTMKLAPGAIHALRVEGSIDMELSDGGVVNIIHNGKDLGVVGDLGQPKRLSLP